MKYQKKLILALFSIFLVGCSGLGAVVSGVEKPEYRVVKASNMIEIRQYAPMIIAEVQVAGEREEAISDGFRLLADYIFGNNQVQQKIAMTAPVNQQQSEKIAMTAPVQQQFDNDRWKVSFVMPSEYSLESLPKPNNSAVDIIEVPAKRYIAIEFSGRSSRSNITENQETLDAYIRENQIQTQGQPIYAFYNPPWTPPFMRRNEILIEIL